jgi:hypothetical protein
MFLRSVITDVPEHTVLRFRTPKYGKVCTFEPAQPTNHSDVPNSAVVYAPSVQWFSKHKVVPSPNAVLSGTGLDYTRFKIMKCMG